MKFYARRQQNLADLDDEPPKNLPYLRQLLNDELERLPKDVSKLESNFYRGLTAMEFIKSYTSTIREALTAHRLPEISSLRQLQTVIRFAHDPEVVAAASQASAQPMHVSREAADSLMEMQNRLLEFVPGRFSTLIHRVQRLLNISERYLCPFYNTDVDPLVDTGKLYEANVKIWSDRVRHSISHLYQLPQIFLRGGLSLARFSSVTLDLLERCEMLPCPIMGMFPDCCERLREASRLLKDWVSQDEQYVLYLRNDFDELEKDRRIKEKNLKQTRHRSSMRQFRIKQLTGEKARLTVELDTLLEKEAELIVDDEALYQDINSLQVDLEIKEFRRDELKRSTGNISRNDLEHQWDELTEELRRLRMKLPVLRRRQAGVRLKMAWIEGKRIEHKTLTNQIHKLETDTWAEKRACIEAEMELEKITASMEKCKAIQHLKSSPDVLKKIFYNMPLPSETPTRPHREVNHSQASTSNSNPTPDLKISTGHGNHLERIVDIIGAQLGRDWPRLYRILPFIPPRGEQTIDNDIKFIESEFVGDALKERSRRALMRWRRFHNRARVDDLCVAVNAINRQDLVEAIDAVLNPIDPAAKDEEPIPDYLSKDLIPYYREVQKFDRLRAAHRI